jgi:hypothetical protein
MTDDDPYRSPGRDVLGAVARSFTTPRRTRYGGSARAAARFGVLAPMSMIVPLPRATSAPWVHADPSEIVEVCEHGLRIRRRAWCLELRWDQIATWDDVTDTDGLVAIELVGSHGEHVRFNRNLRGLDELFGIVAARRAR